jgi:hypothetical protein
MGLRTPGKMVRRLRNCRLNRDRDPIRKEKRPFRRCKRVPSWTVGGDVLNTEISPGRSAGFQVVVNKCFTVRQIGW